MNFHFTGHPPSSKSILNRLLVIQSYFPKFEIKGDSNADDVVKMKSALRDLQAGNGADCGSAGTTLRFLSLRASRMGGLRELTGTPRLFDRPHEEIEKVLRQLGCEMKISNRRMTIQSAATECGWLDPEKAIVIDRSVSSQFGSSLLLNSWNLPFDLRVRFEGEEISEGYFRMTVALMEKLGAKIRFEGGEWIVSRQSKTTRTAIESEIDVSSAFSVAAHAAVSGGIAHISNWPRESLQPDSVFPQILEKMGCRVEVQENALVVEGPWEGLSPIQWNLGNAPDLAPVLAVLCAFADGKSQLTGAPHLIHKESNRIEKSIELIRALGRQARALPDGIEIEGKLDPIQSGSSQFDPDHDHRLAMAASVAQVAGAKIEVTDPSVVEKSYPDFWRDIRSSLRGDV